MKKIVSFIVLMILASAASFADERADVVESITPSSAILFVKTSRIKDFVKPVNFFTAYLLPEEMISKFTRKRDDLKNRTGVDVTNLDSLKKAGIDTGRTASLAVFGPDRTGQERMILFIPVFDEKTFPLKFVEIIKKNAASESVDLYPVLTEYKGRTLYQVHRDMFAVSIDGVFVVASTGELARAVIDVREGGGAGSLALDPNFIDYTASVKKNYDLRAYVARGLLKGLFQNRTRPRKKTDENKKEEEGGDKPVSVRDASPSLRLVADTVPVNPESDEADKLAQGPSPFNSVDYVSLGAIIRPEAAILDIAAKFNNSSATINMLLDAINPGAARSIKVVNPATSACLSIDFSKIEEYCKNQEAGCRYYSSFKREIMEELGIDFTRDVLPGFSGVINLIAGQPRGFGGGYAVFLPMEVAAARKIWDKSSQFLKNKFKGTDRYGAGKLGTSPSFHYVDSRNSTIHVVCDRRGIYLGNDTEILAELLAGKDVKDLFGGDPAAPKADGSEFLYLHIKKESFFGALILLQAYRTREVGGVVDRLKDIIMTGRKSGNFVSLDVKVNLEKRK